MEDEVIRIIFDSLDELNSELEEKNRSKSMGIKDLNRKYNIEDMVKGDVIFCATGITDGNLVKGIKDYENAFEAETYLLHKSSNTNKTTD